MPGSTAQLTSLLESLFQDPGPLESFVVNSAYAQLRFAITWGGSMALAARETVEVLQKQGQIDATFFEALVAVAPAREPEILAVRDLWFPPVAVDPDPVTTIEAAGRLFLGRDALRLNLRSTLKRQGPRLLLVFGGDRSGKSHTWYLLTHLEAATRMIAAWMFDFEEWDRPVTPGDIADDLKARMGLPIPDYDALSGQGSRRTRSWLQHFLREVGQLPNQTTTWCLFFDHVHKVHVPNETREFIESLAREVTDHPVLPIAVLVAGVDKPDLRLRRLAEVAVVESVSGLARAHVKDWVERRAAQLQKQLDELLMNQQLDALFPNGSTLGPEVVAPKLPDLFTKSLRAGL